MFVEPDLLRRARLVEEEQVRRDVGVGSEHALRQTDDRRRRESVVAADVRLLDPVQEQVHRPEQVRHRLLLDAEQPLLQLGPLLDAGAEHKAVWDDHAAAASRVKASLMAECNVHKEAAGACRRVENALAETRRDLFH
jgi:hypothetical protein